MRTSFVLIWLGLCLDVLGCTPRAEDVEPEPGTKTVRCLQVESAPIVESVVLRGTIAPLPDRDVQVAAQVSGRILELLVREGDHVKAGQVLARVDTAQLLDQVHEAEAALARTRSERANAETTRVRIERVFEHGIAARQEVDDAVAHAASAAASEAEAAAAAKRANSQVERAAVTSPLDGVVLKLMKHAGELVDGTPATPIVEVGDASQLELVADVPVPDLVRVKRDASATIALDALPGLELHGHVSAVAPAVDRTTGLGLVRVAIEAVETAPPVGAYGTARVQTGAPRTGLVVPIAALHSATGNAAELTLCGADSIAHTRKVQRGELVAGKVEITSGLHAGESFVVEPVLGVQDNESIEVAP